ncbi:MAG: type transporter [Thermoleophilia bacterium]|nr:type transporter [Thermoleophilia bacterium]
MSWRRLRTLYLRDLRDAIRDGRILVAILLPVALAIYYTVAIPDADERPEAWLVHTGDVPADVLRDVRAAAKGAVDLNVDEVRDATAVRREVREDPSSVGLAATDGAARLSVHGDATYGADLLASITERVALVDPDAPPRIAIERETLEQQAQDAFERLGLPTALGIFSIVMLAGFIGFLVVPVLLVEEVMLGTLDSLQMVATTLEIVIAKLGVGLTYCAVAIGITMASADFDVASTGAFIAVSLVISLALSGFGLVFGLALGDSGRVNTWSGVVLIPLLLPVFLVLGEEQPSRIAAELLPTGAGAQLLAAAADRASVDSLLLPSIVMAAWTVLGFGLLWRMLERRSA